MAKNNFGNNLWKIELNLTSLRMHKNKVKYPFISKYKKIYSFPFIYHSKKLKKSTINNSFITKTRAFFWWYKKITKGQLIEHDIVNFEITVNYKWILIVLY